ncbi:MAG: hypothetical protein ACO1TE_11075 [Prosthecobacter sp.]
MKTSPNKFKDHARGVSTDMSGEAVTRRVRIMDQLWAMGNRMKKASKAVASNAENRVG